MSLRTAGRVGMRRKKKTVRRRVLARVGMRTGRRTCAVL
jgi:hypothetical protein